MDYKTVTPDFAVAPQINTSDIQTIKDLGYVAIINNRPDGETPNQPTSQEIMSAAQNAGLKFYHLPITSGALPQQAIEQTQTTLAQIEGPTFAYCRSGTRSITLWALAQRGQKNADEIMSCVQNAGYDLPFLEQYL